VGLAPQFNDRSDNDRALSALPGLGHQGLAGKTVKPGCIARIKRITEKAPSGRWVMTKARSDMSPTMSARSLRKLLPGFETRADARNRRDVLVKKLLGGGRYERCVGRALKRCRTKAPCETAICPRCVRRLRKSFVWGALNCIDHVRDKCQLKQFPITAFSAVLTGEQYAVGDLVSADLHRINERLQRRHQRCHLPLVFAGVDLSFNTPAGRNKQQYWQFQVYGIVVDLGAERVRAALELLYPASTNTPRPLRVRKCSNLAKALSYVIKPYFSERVNYRDGTGRMNTRTVRLKPDQIRELAPWICRYPLTERYVLTLAPVVIQIALRCICRR
jgi:hypothetical protein